jgi:hypothetical protein
LSVPATVNLPSANSTSLSDASIRCAAIFFALAMTFSVARTIAEPPTAMEREP